MSVAAVSLNCTRASWRRNPDMFLQLTSTILRMDTWVAHFFRSSPRHSTALTSRSAPFPSPVDGSLGLRGNERRVQNAKNALTFVTVAVKYPSTPFPPSSSSSLPSHWSGEDLLPYLMFKKPRILQCVRMHQLSCSVVCCAITLVRVCHSPRSCAVQTPAGPLTPCLPASDALLLCQATVICDWASIGRTTALSPAQIIAVTSSLLPSSILIDATLSIPLLALRLSHGKGHGRSDQLVQVVFSAAESLNERHRDRDMLNSPNSGVQLMIQN